MLVAALFIMMLSTSNQHPMRLPRSTPPQYELIHETETTTEETGSITMQCRDAYAAEPISLSEVEFWLNRTRVCDPSLQEQDNFNVVEVDSYRIKFNLTRRLEGIYTCGRCVNESYVLESTPKTFTCKYSFCILQNFDTCSAKL